ncbi:toll/interleukin-1 receptor domain-containing protein [Flavobacterium taihuense]|uniref:Toll/interleukin-1 receptor domain-containing protein n=1 Tax=Flavobacterium taihuense TaxID=2857508 RepID=A0ABS6XRQ8_9FLAO|nr:toll/interleukin-1 receptor domain-containing protein [Flavobacterium taihuense]MBW4359353.1 toll/interleukin-1 receptor domain-containing protein [Flavobacterium taihuense]
MSFFTEQEFRNIANQKAGFRGLSGTVNETRMFSASSSSTSVFLSHAHQDKEKIEQAKLFFENLGIQIYVDWADQTMPERTSGVTAQNIKKQIITKNDKFILLATNNAVVSKWCNWEIGIADPFKLPNKKMALLPLADNRGNWQGNEYLQIYPRIEKNPTKSGGEGYFVWYPDGSYDNLATWLNR